MRVRKATLRKAILVIITLFILNLRPALAGQFLNEGLLLVPMFGLGLLYLFLRFPVRVTIGKMVLLAITTCFVLYLIAQTRLTSSQDVIMPIQIGIVMLSVAVAAVVMFDRQDALLVLKTLTYLFLILAVSQLVTFGYLLLGGVQHAVHLATLVPSGDTYHWSVELYFPFTVTVGVDPSPIGDVILPRAVGVFREPGIYQMCIILSYFALDYLDIRYRRLARLLLIFSLFTTISTAGYVFFLACLLYSRWLVKRSWSTKRRYTFSVRKVIAGVVSILFLAIAVYIVVWRAGPVSVISKFEQGERVGQINRTLELLPKNLLFGRGFMAFQEEKVGVHLIGILPSIGLFGGFLYLLMIAFGILSNYTKDTFVLFLPVLATLLFAQPVYQKGFTVFLLFLSMKSLQANPAFQTGSVLRKAKTKQVRVV